MLGYFGCCSEGTDVKRCTKCGAEKDESERCKACLAAYGAEYRAKNHEKIKARHERYRMEKAERVKASRLKYCSANAAAIKARHEKHYAENREKIKEDRRAHQAREVATLSDRYIEQLLKTPNPPQELIELKRLHIQILRELEQQGHDQ